MFDLVVLGDCNPDLVLSGADVEPQFGQVEKLVEDAELTIGGSGGIMAAGAARLGLNTAMVGVVGDDLFGRFMVDALIARNVDTTGITVDSNARSGLTVVLARPDDRAILTFPGTISALSREHIDSALLTGSRHAHVASFYLQIRARSPGICPSCSPRRTRPARARRSIPTGIPMRSGTAALETCCARPMYSSRTPKKPCTSHTSQTRATPPSRWLRAARSWPSSEVPTGRWPRARAGS
jgi:hypothetical protein